MADANAYWSFNEIGNDWWGNDLYATMEEAEAEGWKWAKERGLDAFVIGKCEFVPIPTKVDLYGLFEELDYEYFQEAEVDDYDFSLYWDSVKPENEENLKRLSAKITEALEEYIEAAKITSPFYKITHTWKVKRQ